jgi:hypothetical protein
MAGYTEVVNRTQVQWEFFVVYQSDLGAAWNPKTIQQEHLYRASVPEVDRDVCRVDSRTVGAFLLRHVLLFVNKEANSRWNQTIPTW